MIGSVLGLGDAQIRKGRAQMMSAPPQNVTITSPVAAREILNPPAHEQVKDALDSDVGDPEGTVGGKPGAEARRSRKIR